MKIRKKRVKRRHSGDTIKFKFQINAKQLKLRFAPSSTNDLNSNVSTSSTEDPKNAKCVDNCGDINLLKLRTWRRKLLKLRQMIMKITLQMMLLVWKVSTVYLNLMY